MVVVVVLSEEGVVVSGVAGVVITIMVSSTSKLSRFSFAGFGRGIAVDRLVRQNM